MKDFLIFGAYALSLFANYFDWKTTVVALQHGMVEKNPIMRPFITKSPALTAFVTCGLIPVIGVILDVKYSGGWFNGILGTSIAIVAIRNYLYLRKNKISL